MESDYAHKGRTSAEITISGVPPVGRERRELRLITETHLPISDPHCCEVRVVSTIPRHTIGLSLQLVAGKKLVGHSDCHTFMLAYTAGLRDS